MGVPQIGVRGTLPGPSFIAPANHDWYGTQSLYQREEWSPNVHVFDTSLLPLVELDDGLTSWEAAHISPLRVHGASLITPRSTEREFIWTSFMAR